MTTESPLGWTIAYREDAEDRFHRVDLTLTLYQARDFARYLYEITGLDVWAVPNRRSELQGLVRVEDIGSLLTEDDERVLLAEGGELPFPVRPAGEYAEHLADRPAPAVSDHPYGPFTALASLALDNRFQLDRGLIRHSYRAGTVQVLPGDNRLTVELVIDGEIIEQRAGNPEAMARLAFAWVDLRLKPFTSSDAL
jgi:hypothetical protein